MEEKKKDKRYYFIKMKKNYFDNLYQKKMRKSENGAVTQIIYLKLMLATCDQDGMLFYEGVYPTIEEEIAENLNESLQDIKIALDYFRENRLISIVNESDILIPETKLMITSEAWSTQRVRDWRENQKALHCNTDETQCNIDETQRNLELELELELDKDIDKESKSKIVRVRDRADTTATANTNSHDKLYSHGKNNRVKLYNDEYKTLCDRFTKAITDKTIEKMDEWLFKTNNGCRNYFDKLRDWIEHDYSQEQIDQERTKEQSHNKLSLLEQCAIAN